MFYIMCGLPLQVRPRFYLSFKTQSSASGVHSDYQGAVRAPCSHALADSATTHEVTAAASGQLDTATEGRIDGAAKRPRDGAAKRRANGAGVNALGWLQGPCARSQQMRSAYSLFLQGNGVLDYGVTKRYVTTTGKFLPLEKEPLGPRKKKYTSAISATRQVQILVLPT